MSALNRNDGLRLGALPTQRLVRRLGAAFVVGGLASASGACVAVLGMDELSEKRLADLDANVGDGGLDGGSDDAACAADELAEGPKRPGATAATDGKTPAYFALSNFDMGANTALPPTGFDLDHRTTTDIASNGCVFPPGDPTAVLAYGADRNAGIDNTTTPLLQFLAAYAPSLAPSTVASRLQTGKFGVVLRIDGWNGTTNDDDVAIQVYPALGLWQHDADGGLVAGWPVHEDTAGPTDTRDDLWMRDQRFRILNDGSSQRTVQAWIANGTLVARFVELTIPIRTSLDDYRPFDIPLHDAWLTAKVRLPEADGTLASLNEGKIGGRLKTASFIDQARFLYINSQKTFVCSGSGKVVFQYLLDGVCGVRDIRSSYCDDGRSLPCDSISFGATFETYGVDTVGPFFEVTKESYQGSGLPSPDERCLGADDIPSGRDCP